MRNENKKEAEGEPVRESLAFVFKSQSPVEAIDPGMKRQLLGYNDEIMAVRVWFEKGAVGQLHKHPHSQVAYVESGKFEVTVGDVTKTLIAGDSFYVAPDTMHGAVCTETGVLIDMFSPVREDFLGESERSW
ncbi:cupin domain-containing protein [Hyphococcus sp.]|uniref:cupin domain-containing protein n=1 Tax=Hyphococcus sp. TaxID=2038636 RepID=UPI003CCB9839